jgi:hypothetical protein
MLTTVEIEAKLVDFIELLHEWVDRFERLGVPRHKLLAQMRTVLVNMETALGNDREAAAIKELKEERDKLLDTIRVYPEWTEILDKSGRSTGWQYCALCGVRGHPKSKKYPLKHQPSCLRF